MKIFPLFCFLLIFNACQSSLQHEVYNYGEEFELSLGEKSTIGRDNFSIEFVDVLEDSRCSSNVTCIWAGNGKVQLRFNTDDIQLNTYLEPQEMNLDEVNISLLSLDPYPEHPHQFDKEDYKVRLLIIKK
jgi:hypothetical protein